jgi:hypothetical protein
MTTCSREQVILLGTSDLIPPEDLPEAMTERKSANPAKSMSYHDGVNAAKRKLIEDALRTRNFQSIKNLSQNYQFDGKHLRMKTKGSYVCDMKSLGIPNQTFGWDVDLNIPVFEKVRSGKK